MCHDETYLVLLMEAELIFQDAVLRKAEAVGFQTTSQTSADTHYLTDFLRKHLPDALDMGNQNMSFSALLEAATDPSSWLEQLMVLRTAFAHFGQPTPMDVLQALGAMRSIVARLEPGAIPALKRLDALESELRQCFQKDVVHKFSNPTVERRYMMYLRLLELRNLLQTALGSDKPDLQQLLIMFKKGAKITRPHQNSKLTVCSQCLLRLFLVSLSTSTRT